MNEGWNGEYELWICKPGGDRHGPEVQVVSDRVLQVVVHAPLREPRIQVLTQVGRYRT